MTIPPHGMGDRYTVLFLGRVIQRKGVPGRRLGMQGRSSAIQKFTWGRTADKLSSLYAKLIRPFWPGTIYTIRR